MAVAPLCQPLAQWLKAAINQQRPARARKADPGMPSSHANALAFLATSAALALLQGPGGDLRRGSAALAMLPLAGAAFLVRALLHWLLCRPSVAESCKSGSSG